MKIKKLNSQRVGIILAVIFIIGFTASTIYARGFAEMQKPLVQIISTELITFTWSYEASGTVQTADFPHNERFEFTVDIIVPEEAYKSYMSELLFGGGWPVSINIGGVGFHTHGMVVHRRDAIGDIRMTVGFNPTIWNAHPGDEVAVLLELESHEQPAVTLSAIHHDPFTNEYYIFLVLRRDGIWGREFFVERENITFGFPRQIGHLVTINVEPGRPIVAWSEKPLYNGAVVRIFG